jgi:hypothetical protein
MILTSRYSERVWRTHNAVIRFAIGIIVSASLAGQADAVAQTSVGSAPAPSSNSRSQAGTSGVLDKPSSFFPDLAHSNQPLTPAKNSIWLLPKAFLPQRFSGHRSAQALDKRQIALRDMVMAPTALASDWSFNGEGCQHELDWHLLLVLGVAR